MYEPTRGERFDRIKMTIWQRTLERMYDDFKELHSVDEPYYAETCSAFRSLLADHAHRMFMYDELYGMGRR